MFRYILKRIVVFIPTLIIISLLAFVISINAPGDPVERMVSAAQSSGAVGAESVNQKEQKLYWRQKLGLDLPVFYVSLASLADTDTLYRIADKNERKALERIIGQYGNWPQIEAYYTALTRLNDFHLEGLEGLTDSTYDQNTIREVVNQSIFETLSLKSAYDDKVISAKIDKLRQQYQQYAFMASLRPLLGQVESRYQAVKSESTVWKTYIPALHFYWDNQYSRWIFGDGNIWEGREQKHSYGLIRGDFGTSYQTKQPIGDVIMEKVWWSLFFTLVSVLLGYLVSIPLGIHAAVKRDTPFDRVTTVILFILYSMPNFWIATLLLMTFANPDVLPLFPASGVKPALGYPEGASLFEMIRLDLTSFGLAFDLLYLQFICFPFAYNAGRNVRSYSTGLYSDRSRQRFVKYDSCLQTCFKEWFAPDHYCICQYLSLGNWWFGYSRNNLHHSWYGVRDL